MSNTSEFYDYFNDRLDGNHQACNGDPNYEALCIYTKYVLGVVSALIAIWFLYSALGEHGEQRATSSREASIEEASNAPQQRTSWFMVHLKLTLGVCMVGFSVHTFLVAQYPVRHPLGRLADCGVVIVSLSNLMLLQLQRKGAKWFSAFVRVKGMHAQVRSRNVGKAFKQRCYMAVDVLLEKGVPFINLGAFVALFADKLDRPTAYTCTAALQAAVGLHTMYALITKRASVLSKVAGAQQRASGRPDGTSAKQLRRHRALKSKIRGLMFDAGSVFGFSVVGPILVVSNSVYDSSREFIVWQAVLGSIALLNYIIFAFSVRAKEASKRRKLNLSTTGGATSTTKDAHMKSSRMGSGLSVVQSSAVFHHPAPRRAQVAPVR